MDTQHYTMIIQWSEEDEAFVVTVPELPGCMTHGETYEEAAKQGADAIESWISVAKEIGKPIPVPKLYAAA